MGQSQRTSASRGMAFLTTHFFEAVSFKRFVHALNNPRVAFADINRHARQLQHADGEQ